MIPCAALAQETHCTAFHQVCRIKCRRTPDLTAEAVFGKFLGKRNAGFGFAQGKSNFLNIIANGGYNPHSGDYNTFHTVSFPQELRFFEFWPARGAHAFAFILLFL